MWYREIDEAELRLFRACARPAELSEQFGAQLPLRMTIHGIIHHGAARMSYQLIEKQVLYTGKKLRLEVHHLESDEGKRTKKEVVVHPGAVVVLPFLNEKTILLIRNKRYAVDQILLELPAGTL